MVCSRKPKLKVEEHLTVEKPTYACVDVLIFTALYDEAAEIMGKAQSMELYEPSIEGEWQVERVKTICI